VTVTGITGVLGTPWRADVTGWGALLPWDGSPTLDWHVAADDRWHSPGTDGTVRQRRVAGTPVFETRMRVPGGDAVHRSWSVADAGGWTMVEIANESPLPFACAFTRDDVATSRPPAAVPITGIALPATSIVVPVGHRAAVTVGLPHRRDVAPRLPGSVAPVEAVARGWRARADQASRLELPAGHLVDLAVAARCDLLLGGLPGREDPVAFLLAVGELVRLGEVHGEAAAGLAPAVAGAAQDIARRDGWDADAALAAAGLVLARADERLGVADVARIAAARPLAVPPLEPAPWMRAVAALERNLACGGLLLPAGIPASWRGVDFEAHGLVVAASTTLSFAVRWHGARPAVLWELTGGTVELRAPAVATGWRTTAAAGEALWRT
jgi:hypothetical protein